MRQSGLTIFGKSDGPIPADSITGKAMVLDEPLCFVLVETKSGTIIDDHHPQKGECISGSVLVMPGSRGGAATPAQLCETIRLGVGPKAIALPVRDPAVTVGCLVAHRLYNLAIPIFVLDISDYERLQEGDDITLVNNNSASSVLSVTQRT